MKIFPRYSMKCCFKFIYYTSFLIKFEHCNRVKLVENGELYYLGDKVNKLSCVTMAVA